MVLIYAPPYSFFLFSYPAIFPPYSLILLLVFYGFLYTLINKYPSHSFVVYFNYLQFPPPYTATMSARPQNIGVKAIEVYFPKQVRAIR